MVLSSDLLKSEDLKSSYSRYILLDAEKFRYYNDEVKFKKAIEVLSLIDTVHRANDFYKDANSEVRIPINIFYKCIDTGFNNKPFTTEELTEYYNATVLIEGFYFSMLKFKELEDCTPYELEFVLLGLSYDEQDNFTEDQKEVLHDTYGNLFCDVRMKTIDIKTFIEKIKDLIKLVKAEKFEDANKLVLK